MKSKEQTPLAYLMGLMDVSLLDLADYLYVAQTSVSKWKTGARTLKANSPHFAGIVEFFTLFTRDEEKREKLMCLFRDLYPDRDHEKEDSIPAFLRVFLSDKLLPSAALIHSLEESGKLYGAGISVYTGDEGLGSALGKLHAILGAGGGKEILSIFIGRRIADTMGPLEPFLTQLISILELGYKAQLLLDPHDADLPLCALATLFAHPGMGVRFIDEEVSIAEKELWLLVDGKAFLISRCVESQPRYTALYTDAFTLAHYRASFLSLWNQASTPFGSMTSDDLKPDLFKNLTTQVVDERFDWLIPSLPPMTMRRDLLMEALEANGVAGRVWSRVLGCFDALEGVRLRLLIPAVSLRASQENSCVLSLMAGQEMRLNESQARRHLLDTAALLREEIRVSLVPLHNEMPADWRRVSLFVMRNVCAGVMDFMTFTIRYTFDPVIIERTMAILDSFSGALTTEMKDSRHVAELLERVALSS